MTYAQTRVLLCCIALLSASGCRQANKTNEKPQAESRVSGAALREPTASDKLATENAKRARVAELTSLIATAQTQRGVLVEQQSKIEAQLATYQADSTAKLDQLKTEMRMLELQKSKAAMNSAQSNAKQMDAFSERARNQLEQALAMDQEYQAQLAQTVDELHSIEANMVSMRAELESLRTAVSH